MAEIELGREEQSVDWAEFGEEPAAEEEGLCRLYESLVKPEIPNQKGLEK